MKSIRTITNQNLFDIAVQEYGTVLAVVDLAIANGLSVTDALEVGKNVKLSESQYQIIDVVKYFSGRNYKVATDGETLSFATLEGIGNWIIQVDFEIR